MTVDAELRVPLAAAQLVHFHLADPPDGILREEDAYRFDLCLSPRPDNARACYRDHWGPHRFERLGNIFVLPPRETMQARSDGGHQSSIIYKLERAAVHGTVADLKWNGPSLEASLDLHDANIRNLLLRLAQEIRHPGFASAVLAELIASQMAIELSRFCAAMSEAPSRGALATWRLRLIDERLEDMPGAPKLAELAALCNLSVRQLTRSFRKRRGYSIGDHIASRQIERAKRLLSADRSVKSIAYTLGFASPSSFCFAFRRATGQTPRQFKHGVMPGRI
jgi:AraC family transcriptional regulator